MKDTKTNQLAILIQEQNLEPSKVESLIASLGHAVWL